MKQIRLFLVLVLFSHLASGQTCKDRGVSAGVTICQGQSTSITLFLSVSGVNYQLRDDSNNANVGLPQAGNGGNLTFTVSPSVTTTYNILIYTGSCSKVNSTKVTITVNSDSSISSIDNDDQILCINTAITPIHYTITNATGATVSNLPAGVSYTYNAGVVTISGIPTASGIFNYVVSPTGGCGTSTLGSTITVNFSAYGGSLTDVSGYNPATVCYSSPTGQLNLTGQIGNVEYWERSIDGGTTWSTIANTANLVAYNYSGLTISTVFRASVNDGGLCGSVKSNRVMVNVIPNIKPNPVTASPATICNGDSSVLNAQTSGYATNQYLGSAGAFSDANPTGWGTDGQYSGNYLHSGGSNTNENPFALSATNGGTYSGIVCTANGKFAIAHGNLWYAPYNGTSYMETSTFSTTGLASATLQFKHAYNLLAGASIKIELSFDGGASYPALIYSLTGVAATTGNFNPFTTLQNIDLSSYVGQSNLRLKFTYFSNNTDSLWAIDELSIPSTPTNIATEWIDGNGNVVGTGTTFTVTPPVTTTYGVRSTFLINGTSSCSSSGSLGTSYVTVTVNQRPTATIGPSQTVCNSTPATLSIALSGTGPWNITYSDGTTATSVTTNVNPYIFNTPNLAVNKTYRITALSDSKCTAIAADFNTVANINVLNGTPGVWTGMKSTDWFDCLNWSGGGDNPPAITTDVVIPSGSANMPNIDASTPKAIVYSGIANARDLLISGSASLTMSNASKLNIGKDWKNNGVFTSGNGTVVFAGTTANQIQYINQSVKNNEQFYNLTLNATNGAKGIILPDNFQLTVANSLYLQSGDLRLTNEAQLVQNGNGINNNAGTGRLFRDQQGKKSSFHYTYWSSPVSTNNVNYTLGNVLKDGTDVISNPFNTTAINFGDGIYFADGPATYPIKISNRWLYKYSSSANLYANWVKIDSNSTINVGEGFIMKGCDGGVTPFVEQNLVFVGKPNNGDINVTLGVDQTYLVGNPYPSALDADKFIKDNIKDGGNASTNKFNGVLYFWDHFGGYSHYLASYVGGYATYSLMGGVVAVSNDPMGANTGASGTKIPKKYIPVAQGFFISASADSSLTTNNPNLSAITGGVINFKNSQRVFMTESGGNSVMMRTSATDETLDVRKKIRLLFTSASGVNRQLLIGADQSATSSYDLAYDAPMIDVNKDDMFWPIGNGKFIIQAVNELNLKSEIALGVQLENAGECIFQLNGLENFEKNMPLYLFDSVSNQYYDLSNPVKIVLDKGEYKDRFSIRFEKNTLSVHEADFSNEFVIYFSNPDKAIHISNTLNRTLEKLQVYNMLGQKVFEKDLGNTNESVSKWNINDQATATYIVKLKAENGIVTKKIIIN
ncbi:T9SS type A sorting domain-containing protein [Flavobacterium sp.]|uniref:T9SS type A sorting domain-containing protein n=1 Tax=Flavobacterium sp. TaxID=239 RepID=UPI003D0F149C